MHIPRRRRGAAIHILIMVYSDRFIAAWHQVTKDKVPISIEYRLKKTWTSIDKITGQELSGEHWVQSTAFPEIDLDGSVSTVQGWVYDISYRKFSERIQAQRLEDALENKRQTENFVSTSGQLIVTARLTNVGILDRYDKPRNEVRTKCVKLTSRVLY